MQNFFIVVEMEGFEKTIDGFPDTGHSVLPCDWSFAVFENHLRKVERVYTPRRLIYIRLYGKSVPKVVTQKIIFNFLNMWLARNKKKFHNQHKISLNKAQNDEVQCSQITSFPIYFNFNIERYNFQQNMYKSDLKLKTAKYSNIMPLARQLIYYITTH